jgi:tRNA(fMet)-specific endonuclease VapC
VIYLLDTDHLSLWQRGTPEGAMIRSRVRQLAPDDYGITVVTYAEQAKGWLAAVARAQNPDAEVRAFGEMQQSLRFCTAFAIWGFTSEAAATFTQLRQSKIRIGTQDLRIASIALVNDATLLTRNTQDFACVPNLRFDDWTK